MSNERFRREFGELLRRQGANIDAAMRRTAIQIASRVIQMSPVDTGRFRGNWNVGIPAIDFATREDVDPTGAGSLQRAQSAIGSWRIGESLYVTNSLPYAKRLEEGYSQQAPAGMVKVTVAEFQSAVRKALRELR
jgi:hypothetical protein